MAVAVTRDFGMAHLMSFLCSAFTNKRDCVAASIAFYLHGVFI